MAKIYDEIDEPWREWIDRQPMFFVATAPLDARRAISVSDVCVACTRHHRLSTGA